jgi:hypothetical protein
LKRDFEAANIEYIEFRMMDPTASKTSPTWVWGDLFSIRRSFALLAMGVNRSRTDCDSNDNTSVDQTLGKCANNGCKYEFSSTNREQTRRVSTDER